MLIILTVLNDTVYKKYWLFLILGAIFIIGVWYAISDLSQIHDSVWPLATMQNFATIFKITCTNKQIANYFCFLMQTKYHKIKMAY